MANYKPTWETCEVSRISNLLMDLAIMLQKQWILRRVGWRSQDPMLEKAAEYAGKRTTWHIRLLRQCEPWLNWEVQGDCIVVVRSLGIRCVPPPFIWPWDLPTPAMLSQRKRPDLPLVEPSTPAVPSQGKRPVPPSIPAVPSRVQPVVPSTPAVPSQWKRPVVASTPAVPRGWTGPTKPGQWVARGGRFFD